MLPLTGSGLGSLPVSFPSLSLFFSPLSLLRFLSPTHSNGYCPCLSSVEMCLRDITWAWGSSQFFPPITGHIELSDLASKRENPTMHPIRYEEHLFTDTNMSTVPLTVERSIGVFAGGRSQANGTSTKYVGGVYVLRGTALSCRRCI